MKVLALCVGLIFVAASVHALNFYSIGAESQGSYTIDNPLASSITNIEDSYGFNIAVSGMGKKKLFFIWDLRLQVGFMGTNQVIGDTPDVTFYGGDVMGGFGYRILAPTRLGIEIAPTISVYADVQVGGPSGFLFQYGPALGVNVFLKLGKGFGVGARAIAKYSIPTRTFQPSIQLGVLF